MSVIWLIMFVLMFIFYCVVVFTVNRGSSVSIVTGYGLGFDPRQRQRIFPVTSASRPGLGPTQPPIQWVPRALSPGVKRGRGVMLTTHPLLVPRSGKRGAIPPLHPSASMACSGTGFTGIRIMACSTPLALL
jgi:hypothetical protein